MRVSGSSVVTSTRRAIGASPSIMPRNTSSDSPWMQADARMDLAEVLRLAGRRDEADAAVRQALVLYEQKGVLPAAERARALLAG